MVKNQVQHVKLMKITWFTSPTDHLSNVTDQKNACSKKCPNNWSFCLAYYLISFDPNHVTQGLVGSQDVIVSYINRSCCQIMSEDHTNLIFQKQANIGTFF